MTPCKTRLLFVALIALTLGALSDSALSQGMTVPDSECPSSFVAPALPSCQWVAPWEIPVCSRTDTSIMQTNPGQPKTVFGDSLDCTNCAGCPESTPGAENCQSSLSVTYVEQVTVTLAKSTMQNANTIQSQLDASIGHPVRTAAGSALCGIQGLPGCKMQSFLASMVVTEGIIKAMDHQYYWSANIAHRPNMGNSTWLGMFGCNVCHEYGSLPKGYTSAQGRITSTVAGSCYGAAVVNCETDGMTDCP